MAIALAAAICLASGYLLVAAGWPRSRPTLSACLTKLSLAAGFGLGISSVSFFLARMIGTDRFLLIDILLLALLCVLYAVIRVRSASTLVSNITTQDFAVPVWLQRVLTASFVIAAVAALYAAALRLAAFPQGDGWDAFAIWNLHARFLFLGGAHWRDGFNALIPWSHPDYPLLLPAAAARFWSYLGHNTPSVPAILGLVFTFGTLILLVTSLAQLRGPNAALLAGVTLLSTPFFIEQGTAQYADVPLSFFILASIVLLHFGFQRQAGNNRRPSRGPWVLAGLAAGFAAWTKNEGLLFLLALSLAYVSAFTSRERPQDKSGRAERNWSVPVATLLGVLPVLAVIAWFKYSVATAGDLFSRPGLMLHDVLTPSRYGIILRWYVKEFFRFGDWWILPGTGLLVVFYFLTLERGCPRQEPAFRASVATLGLILAGYVAIYLVTPRDLNWHLRFSLNRLFLQLWPATLFLFFRFVPCPPSGSISK